MIARYYICCPFCSLREEINSDEFELYPDKDHPVWDILYKHLCREHPDWYEQEEHFRMTVEEGF